MLNPTNIFWSAGPICMKSCEIYLEIFWNKNVSNIFLISAHTPSFSTQTPTFEKTIPHYSWLVKDINMKLHILIVQVKFYKSNILFFP